MTHGDESASPPENSTESVERPPHPLGSGASEASKRAASWVFGGVVVAAFPIILFVFADYYWFDGDDWSYIVGRQLDSFSSLYENYQGHWPTVPVLAFQSLWGLFGLKSYVPYQVTVVAVHLVTAVLLRWIMRRSGVGPWLATAAAVAFVFLGSGKSPMIWAAAGLQLGCALAFGLGQLLLADHDGPIRRRDWLGLGAGLLALMTSGVAVATIFAVGLAVLVRRGWRAAAFHCVPLAVLFVVYAIFVAGDDAYSPFGYPTLSVFFRWFWTNFTGFYQGFGGFTIVALVLVAVLVVGLAIAWVPNLVARIVPRAPQAESTGSLRRAEIAAPTALLVSSVVFSATLAAGRWWWGVPQARNDRFIYVGVALTLPALALAAEAISRRWRVLTPFAIALLLVGMPANIRDFEGETFRGKAFHDRNEALARTVVRMPFAAEVPSNTQVMPEQSPLVTTGFLLDARASGKLKPTTGPVAPGTRDELMVRLGVYSDRDRALPPNCRQYDGAVELSPDIGTEYGLKSAARISLLNGEAEDPVGVRYRPGFTGTNLTIQLDGMELLIEPDAGGNTIELCTE